MARRREHLARAPIAEALIDVRVLSRDGITADSFSDLAGSVGAGYDRPALMHSFQARFGMDQGRVLEPTQVQAQVGWMYRSTSEATVAQFRIDGFTFSKLEPYTSWERVFEEAHRLWRLYVEKAQPLEASRLAVRYINRLRLPGPVELREYLEAPPVLPPPIPQEVREFLSRVVVYDEVRNASAILIQALEPSLDPATIPVLLDIDAFRGELALPPNDPSISGVFEQLRHLKNDIFFATITEKTVEMYE